MGGLLWLLRIAGECWLIALAVAGMVGAVVMTLIAVLCRYDFAPLMTAAAAYGLFRLAEWRLEALMSFLAGGHA